MNADPRPEAGTSDSLWLELAFGDRTRTFELESSETRAVIVGSDPSADFRIEQSGVAPVQFYIERDAGSLWIVPAYRAEELRVDTARITGPKRISTPMVIEFCGLTIQARMLAATHAHTQDCSFRLRANDVTADRHRTVVLGRLPAPSTPAQATVRLSPSTSADVTPVQRTVVIQPIRVIPFESSCPRRPGPREGGELRVNPSDSSERVASNDTRAAHDTVHVTPFWSRDLERPISSAVNAPTQCTTVFDVPCVPPQVRWTHGWLANLGVYTKRRPRTVWLVGSTSAFLISASISFVTRYAMPAATPRTASSVPVTPVLSRVAPLQADSTAPSPAPTADALVIIPAVAMSKTSGEKKQPSDPELVSAVLHVISGRYKDAQQAYAALAARSPFDPSLAVVSRLLARKATSECSSSPSETAASCPEVKQ